MPADLPPRLSSRSLGAPHPAGNGPQSRQRPSTYTVRPGDTVSSIAARHNTTVAALVRANALSENGRWIRPGQRLRLTDGARGQSASTSSPAFPASPTATTSRTVTVRPGDTLSGIAAKHGVPLSSLARSNGISNTRLIYPGQKLVIQRPAHAPSAQPPGRSGPSASAAAASPPSRAPQQSVRVQADDTLYGLAAEHGVSVSSIIQANPGIRPRSLPVGSTVRIPSTASTQPHPEPDIPEPIEASPTGREVEDSFLHHPYPAQVASSAEVNREYLASVPVPSRSQTRSMIITTARRHGVDPALMLALAYQVSGWNQRTVSPANAIGIMQVVPSSGEWASSLVGRRLNLLDPQDNVTAGVVIMRALQRSASNQHEAIGGYYQGLSSVQRHGLFADTRAYVKSITALRARL